MTDLFTIDPPRDEPQDDDTTPQPNEPLPGRRREALFVGVGVVVFAAIVALIVLGPILSGRITSWTPAVGDCVTKAETDADVANVKQVDCGDALAANKVVGVFQDREASDLGASDDPCFAYPQAESEIFYGTAHNGFILCLAPKI